MSRSGWGIRIGLTLAAGGALIWAFLPRALPVDVVTVSRGPLTSSVTAEGRTRVKDLFVVAAPVDGELERVVLTAGTLVTPSTVVARLRPAVSRPLDERSRAEALASVSTARAAIQRAEAARNEAQAALTHAEATRDTMRELAKGGAAAPKDAEHSEHEVEIRRQALAESRAALDAARSELVRAEAAASTTRPTEGAASTLVYSPVSGRVLRVLRESAGPVTAGTKLLELGDIERIEIAADFLTSDATSIKPGAAATIRDWGAGAPLRARVNHIEPSAFTKVSPLGLEEQRVSVVLDLQEQPPVTFGHDYHVNVDVGIWNTSDAVLVPSTALFRTGRDWSVFVAKQGRAKLTTVTIGRADETRTVIESGLSAGDVVVLQPSDTITDGARLSAQSSVGGTR